MTIANPKEVPSIIIFIISQILIAFSANAILNYYRILVGFLLFLTIVASLALVDNQVNKILGVVALFFSWHSDNGVAV
jgi:hypothetical protein